MIPAPEYQAESDLAEPGQHQDEPCTSSIKLSKLLTNSSLPSTWKALAPRTCAGDRPHRDRERLDGRVAADEATMRISTASSTSCAISASNWAITNAASVAAPS